MAIIVTKVMSSNVEAPEYERQDEEDRSDSDPKRTINIVTVLDDGGHGWPL